MNRFAFALACAATPVHADDVIDTFIEANLLSAFYHELGHALIDVMDLPVYGQEEDAADTASIMFLDAIFEEDSAVVIAYGAATGLLIGAETTGEDIAWSDTHGADLQRFYNLVCLFYGGNTETRAEFAEDMGLPEDRAETCEEEYALAHRSWSPVLDAALSDDGGDSLIFHSETDSFGSDIISTEVTDLNALIDLPVDVIVAVDTCGEANAFYDPEERVILICSEFEDYLREVSPVDD
jgi:hypothetical protein